MADFKTILIRKRKELGLSQKEMAEYLHVTRQAISKWENGKSMPDMATLPDVAELLGVSVDELLTGKEPEKQIVERVVEKEVVKPMSTFKILSIVLPIVMVVILASILMGIYIPKAIAKQTPPVIVIPEPEPEIVYTDVFLKGKSNSEDSRFHADPIKDKAYFDLNMQYSSEYSLYITAPKGAVATLNDEVIAEFNDAETKVYTQYFDVNPLVGINNITIHRTTDFSSLNLYHVVVDLTKCEERRKIEGAWIVVKQRTGFEGVVIPANSSYFVALDMPENVGAWHYVIKSNGIGYAGNFITRKEVKYDVQGGDINRPGNLIDDFYLAYDGRLKDGDGKYCDWQIGFKNRTDRDIELELEEKPIEEISLFEEVSVNSIYGSDRIVVFKLNAKASIYLMSECLVDNEHCNVQPVFYGETGSFTSGILGQSYREGWYISIGNNYVKSDGVVYVRVLIRANEKKMRFLIDSEAHYNFRKYNASLT